MAFNIRQFAKNALLSAQTALDNALDIQEGDESDGSESNNEQDENASTCHTVLRKLIVIFVNLKNRSRKLTKLRLYLVDSLI